MILRNLEEIGAIFGDVGVILYYLRVVGAISILLGTYWSHIIVVEVIFMMFGSC